MIPLDQPPSHEIQEIIMHFLEGSASEQEIEKLYAWLQENKSNRRYLDEVSTTYQASVTLNRFNAQKSDEAWNDLSHKLEGTKIIRFDRAKWLTGIAASIALIATATLVIFLKIQPLETKTQRGSLVRNSPGHSTRIILPDSSIVYLNTNSTLEYPPAFGTESRDVILKGEAFFDVRKGTKLFLVKTDNMTIKVKGTRFNVQAYKSDSQVKTTLEEGAVELQLSGEGRSYSMKPGDQIILNTKQRKVSLQRVDPSRFTAWKEDKLAFDNATLEEIVYKLENRYRVNIIVDSELSKSERFTITIGDESLDEVLELIQLSSRLKVRREINDIILYQ